MAPQRTVFSGIFCNSFLFPIQAHLECAFKLACEVFIIFFLSMAIPYRHIEDFITLLYFEYCLCVMCLLHLEMPLRGLAVPKLYHLSVEKLLQEDLLLLQAKLDSLIGNCLIEV